MNAKLKTRGSGSTKIYNSLREKILTMELMPGHPLDEVGLAAEFGVSRSPVREALLKLNADELTVSLPNKSTIVSPLNVEQFPQYVDALDLVQRAVTHLAAIHRTEENLDQIGKLQLEFAATVKQANVVGMIESNRNFHMSISKAAKNPYLSQSYSRLLDEGRRFLRLYFHFYGDTLPDDFPDEHGMIIEAIANRDAKRAEQLAHEHTMEFQGRFIDYMKSRNTDKITIQTAK